MTYQDEAQTLLGDLVALRRSIHTRPEVGLDLPLTQQAVLDALAGLDLEITTGTRTTSVTAVLRGGRPGPAVLLRGDMDALPIVEETGLPYASTNGAMHACGHDLHVAGLVGAARLLHQHREELPGDVIFMFQPGEEGYNGASVMIDEGVLDAAGSRPIAAYAGHVAPGERGQVFTRPGPILAGSNELYVTVHGRGGHGSIPQWAIDPVPAITELATALQTMATRRFDAMDPIVLSVTQLLAGEAINVIPSHASLGATVRTLSAASLETLREEVVRLAEGIASAHGCTADVTLEVKYPVTVNDPAEAGTVLARLAELFGGERVSEAPSPAMGSEDFSFVLQEVPGCYFYILTSFEGANPAQVESNHSPRVQFDDAFLGDLAAALAHLAHQRLIEAERSVETRVTGASAALPV